MRSSAPAPLRGPTLPSLSCRSCSLHLSLHCGAFGINLHKCFVAVNRNMCRYRNGRVSSCCGVTVAHMVWLSAGGVVSCGLCIPATAGLFSWAGVELQVRCPRRATVARHFSRCR